MIGKGIRYGIETIEAPGRFGLAGASLLAQPTFGWQVWMFDPRETVERALTTPWQ